ncbi:hypothetical protein ABGN05_14065 [Aquibium sp. LZ166]|uniref:Uncharacterized protein n=1 Tax=Aquibium pacificus TaxID=3153579 RepID=A0ABV3SJ98_9HYPH
MIINHGAIKSGLFGGLFFAMEIYYGRWKKFSILSNATKEESDASKLPPHLQHDIGFMDCRPPHPLPLEKVLKERQNTLESMWLRYF